MMIQQQATQTDIDNFLGIPEGWVNRPLAVKIYVEDVNNVEKIRHEGSISVLSEGKQVLLTHAIQRRTSDA